LKIDEKQNTFIEYCKVYSIELNKTIHLLKNAIYDNIFSTFRNYSYNFINSNPKVLIDTLTSVLTRTTTRSVQPIKVELFNINAESFDFLRTYLNRAIYLYKRINNTNLEITENAIQIILLITITVSATRVWVCGGRCVG